MAEGTGAVAPVSACGDGDCTEEGEGVGGIADGDCPNSGATITEKTQTRMVAASGSVLRPKARGHSKAVGGSPPGDLRPSGS